jgi:hypothetical protein
MAASIPESICKCAYHRHIHIIICPQENKNIRILTKTNLCIRTGCHAPCFSEGCLLVMITYSTHTYTQIYIHTPADKRQKHAYTCPSCPTRHGSNDAWQVHTHTHIHTRADKSTLAHVQAAPPPPSGMAAMMPGGDGSTPAPTLPLPLLFALTDPRVKDNAHNHMLKNR